jgi:hypothetical protein
MARARKVGRNVGKAMLLPYDKVKYVGDGMKISEAEMKYLSETMEMPEDYVRWVMEEGEFPPPLSGRQIVSQPVRLSPDIPVNDIALCVLETPGSHN